MTDHQFTKSMTEALTLRWESDHFMPKSARKSKKEAKRLSSRADRRRGKTLCRTGEAL